VVLALSGAVGSITCVIGGAVVADGGEVVCAFLEDVGGLFVGGACRGLGPKLRLFRKALARLGRASTVFCRCGSVSVFEAAQRICGAGVCHGRAPARVQGALTGAFGTFAGLLRGSGRIAHARVIPVGQTI
jgi:hypothetical protein